MSEDIRSVSLYDYQVEILEELGVELLRNDDPRASKVLAIALAWRSTPPRIQRSNVVPIDSYSRRVGSSA